MGSPFLATEEWFDYCGWLDSSHMRQVKDLEPAEDKYLLGEMENIVDFHPSFKHPVFI
jgi:hypothetical protein